MTTPKPLAEFEQEQEAVLQTIADRWRATADEIIHLELEQHILAIRLKTLYARLPARYKQMDRGSYQFSLACRGCSVPGDSAKRRTLVVEGSGAAASRDGACPECGSQGADYWKERLGITQAVQLFRT